MNEILIPYKQKDFSMKKIFAKKRNKMKGCIHVLYGDCPICRYKMRQHKIKNNVGSNLPPESEKS